MADQMPEGSDNAGSYDLDITTPQNMAPLSTDTSANGAGIASDLEKQIKRLTEQYRKGTVILVIEIYNELIYTYFIFSELQNNDNNEYNILKCLIDEKYKLLFNLNSPINSILSAQIENEKMLKKIVQQLNNLLNQSAEYLRAYVAHCDEAVKANNLLRSNTEYDEFIHMVRYWYSIKIYNLYLFFLF